MSDCTCHQIPCCCLIPAPTRGSIWRFGSGNPTVISTDQLNDNYVNTVNGEVWQFNGTIWVDQLFSIFGSAGAPGANGGTLLYNNHVAAMNVSGANQVLKQYTLEKASTAPVPFEDGDQLFIETAYTLTPNTNFKQPTITFDAGVVGGGVSANATVFEKFILRTKITRINSTTIRIFPQYRINDISGHTFPSFAEAEIYSASDIPVSDLDATDVDINAMADGTNAGDMICEFLTVELKKLM